VLRVDGAFDGRRGPEDILPVAEHRELGAVAGGVNCVVAVRALGHVDGGLDQLGHLGLGKVCPDEQGAVPRGDGAEGEELVHLPGVDAASLLGEVERLSDGKLWGPITEVRDQPVDPLAESFVLEHRLEVGTDDSGGALRDGVETGRATGVRGPFAVPSVAEQASTAAQARRGRESSRATGSQDIASGGPIHIWSLRMMGV